MADLNASALPLPVPDTSAQLGAIARVRLQIFKNSLRTMRGRMEVVSSVFIGLWFVALGLAGAAGLAVGAWLIISRGHTEWLAALFWPIFVFWIFFPLVATAFTEAFDSSNLLRYPLRYSSFLLANLIYGSLDGSTVVGLLWLLGIALGAVLGAPPFGLWSVLVVVVFGASNILLVRALFSWIERWLAQRKTREIMGIVFFLAIISFQMIGPITNKLRRQHFALPAYVTQTIFIQKFLPPGLAAAAINRALHADWKLAVGSFLLLACYPLAFLLVLNVRLRAQYAGESFGEGVSRERMRVEKVETQSGWMLPGLSGQVAAIMEKEARYLSRSGPMLFALIMPAVVLFLFHMGGNPGRPNAFARNPNLAFPIGAAYALLLLTNLVYNNFGADGAGVQLFFVSPVRFRSVVIAKNLVHAAILILEMCLVWTVTYLLYSPPSSDVLVATLVAVLFAAPLNFCVGNLLSLYTPKKYDYGTFGRQRAPGLTVLASFGVQAFTIAVAVCAVLVSRHYGSLWVATAIFAVLAAISFGLYRFVLGRIDGIALLKRESIISVLAKTS
jgi:ABC-2 type transport system permease protein